MPIVSALSLTVVIAALGVSAYLVMTNQRLLAFTRETLKAPTAQVTVMESTPGVSGEMRSAHWRLMPGGIGGVSPGAREASY
jgi:hypothetical protein